MSAPTIPLNNSKTIPQIGFGTSPLNDKDVVPAVITAIEAGYRHIDTAYRYNNERGVGQGIRDSGIDRKDLFVTTKLDGVFQGNDRAIDGLDESLRRLGLDYVDLLLIHWPLPQRDEYVSTWKTFEKLVAAGKARSIGLSNFKPAHIDRLLAESTIRPAVNQIQLNPRITRPEQRAYNSEQGIVTEAWSPLGAGNDLLENSSLAAIAAKYGKTPGQVVLRWHIELGTVAIPRSANPGRIAQNIDIFDFALTNDEISAISALDTGDEPRVDSDNTGH
jgi:2,5-diketo-D-gluconate reductase A